MMITINKFPSAYSYVFRSGERVFNSRSRQCDSTKRSGAYSYVFKPGERVFDGRSRQYDSTKRSSAYSHVFKPGERVFDGRSRQYDSTKRSGAYSHVFKPGERVFDSRSRQYDSTKRSGAYSHVFKPGERVFDSRESLPAYPIGKKSDLDQQQQLKQQAIDIITSDIQRDGSWNNLAGEIAVKVVTALPAWPRNNHVAVKLTGGHCVEYGKQSLTRPLELQLAQGHYEAVIAGQVTAVASDGNCFYHALLLTLKESEQQQLLGTAFVPYDRKSVADDAGNPNVMALRQLLASHLQENKLLISDYLTDNGVSYEQVIREDKQAMASSRALQIERDAALACKLQQQAVMKALSARV